MGNYSLVDFAEIKKIISYYNLPKAIEFQATIEGISNSNYKVTLENGQNVLLKISNDKTLEQLLNEQDILETLGQHNYSYALRPLKSLKGRLIYEHDGKFGVVFPYINGLPPKITPKTVFQIGEALGELHSLEIHKEDLNVLRPHDLVGFGGQSIKEYTDKPEAASDFVEAFRKTFPGKLENIPYDIFPSGIIHGDLYYDNSLFYEGQIVTLIDFEQSGRGRFILDLGIAISGCCLSEGRDGLSRELISSFLKGYSQKRPLIAIEKEYLHMAVAVGFFSIGLWRIKRFYEGNLDHSKRLNYRDLLSRCEKFCEEFQEEDDLFLCPGQ